MFSSSYVSSHAFGIVVCLSFGACLGDDVALLQAQELQRPAPSYSTFRWRLTTPKKPVLQPAIIQPSTSPYSFPTSEEIGNETYASQFHQDKLLEPLLGLIGKGFYVESGAVNGWAGSNTLHYELNGWEGLLIEPNPRSNKELLTSNRKAFVYAGALSPTTNNETIKFSNAKDEGNIIAGVGADSLASGNPYLSDYFEVPAQPLVSLLQQIGRRTVDFWSLDIETMEGVVLNATDFSQVEIGVMLIETVDDLAANVLSREGFHKIGDAYGTMCDRCANYWHQLDSVYVNPEYFRRRDLDIPKALPSEDLHWYDQFCSSGSPAEPREVSRSFPYSECPEPPYE